MASDTAVSKDGVSIPLIDFSKFLHGDPLQRSQTAKSILTGFQTAGFIYLQNHPIPLPTIEHTFSQSARFFSQSDSIKNSISWTTPQANRGYSAPGREKVTSLTDAASIEHVRAQAPDLKESYEIGRENEPGHPNRWPADDGDGVADGFKRDMMEFFDRCMEVHLEVMRAIAVGMGLGDDFFDKFLDVRDNTLRLLHYPAVDTKVFEVNPNAVRAGEHSDYGCITLLFQDKRGGLQVKSPTGTFVDATPIDGTIVVNAGDLLARWSNDTIKSTIHRVVEPPFHSNKNNSDDTKDAGIHPARYSIAYFCNPNFDSFIDVLPGTYEKEEDKKYEGVNCGEYLVRRLTETY